MATTYDYYKDVQQPLGTVKPGSCWFFISIDFSKQNMAQNDILKIMEVKNHWILKSGFTRERSACSAASSVDIGTTSAGNEIDNDVAIDSGTDTWLRCDTLDDDGPIAITADGYLYATLRDAGPASDGILDIMLEIVIPHGEEDSVDSLAE